MLNSLNAHLSVLTTILRGKGDARERRGVVDGAVLDADEADDQHARAPRRPPPAVQQLPGVEHAVARVRGVHNVAVVARVRGVHNVVAVAVVVVEHRRAAVEGRGVREEHVERQERRVAVRREPVRARAVRRGVVARDEAVLEGQRRLVQTVGRGERRPQAPRPDRVLEVVADDLHGHVARGEGHVPVRLPGSQGQRQRAPLEVEGVLPRDELTDAVVDAEAPGKDVVRREDADGIAGGRQEQTLQHP